MREQSLLRDLPIRAVQGLSQVLVLEYFRKQVKLIVDLILHLLLESLSLLPSCLHYQLCRLIVHGTDEVKHMVNSSANMLNAFVEGSRPVSDLTTSGMLSLTK